VTRSEQEKGREEERTAMGGAFFKWGEVGRKTGGGRRREAPGSDEMGRGPQPDRQAPGGRQRSGRGASGWAASTPRG
jgi:hypothetical protein